jgi:hypothetical protein
MRNRVAVGFFSKEHSYNASDYTETLNADKIVLRDYNSLQMAAEFGLLHRVIALLASETFGVDATNLAGQPTPLQLALDAKHFLIAKILIALQADLSKLSLGSACNVLSDDLALDYPLVRSLVLWSCYHSQPEFGIRLLTKLEPLLLRADIADLFKLEITNFLKYATTKKLTEHSDFFIRVGLKLQARFYSPAETNMEVLSADVVMPALLSANEFIKLEEYLVKHKMSSLLYLSKFLEDNDLNSSYVILINSEFNFSVLYDECIKHAGLLLTINAKHINILKQMLVLTLKKGTPSYKAFKLVIPLMNQLSPDQQLTIISQQLALYYEHITDSQVLHRAESYGLRRRTLRGFEVLGNDVNFIILHFLNAQDLSVYSHLSHFNHKIATGRAAKAFIELLELHVKLRATQRALISLENAFNQAVEQKRPSLYVAGLPLAMMSAFLIIAAWFTHQASSRMNNAMAGMADMKVEGASTTCEDQYHYYYYDRCDKIASQCEELCRDFDSYQSDVLGWGVGGIGGSAALVLCCLARLYAALRINLDVDALRQSINRSSIGERFRMPAHLPIDTQATFANARSLLSAEQSKLELEVALKGSIVHKNNQESEEMLEAMRIPNEPQALQAQESVEPLDVRIDRLDSPSPARFFSRSPDAHRSFSSVAIDIDESKELSVPLLGSLNH